MRYLYFSLVGLAFATPAPAQTKPEKPILVLDAGGHTGRVYRVLFTPDGKELISIAEDKTIRIWDVVTGEPLRVLRPPIGPGLYGTLYAAAVSRDGQRLAVAGYAQRGGSSMIYVIGLATGRIERFLPQGQEDHYDTIDALAFSPDGRLLVANKQMTALVWDIAAGKIIRTFTGHEGGVLALAFSPDGGRLVTICSRNQGRIWSMADGKTEAEFTSEGGFSSDLRGVAWSPDGQTIAVGRSGRNLNGPPFGGSVRVWNANGTLRNTFERLGGPVTSVAFTPDSRELLVTRGDSNPAASLLDLATGRQRTPFSRHTLTGAGQGTLSPDGKLAATAAGGEILLWKTDDGTVVHRLAGKGRETVSAGWSKDGKLVAWGNTPRPATGKWEPPPGKHWANHTLYLQDNDRGPLERTFRLADLEFGPAPDATFRRAIAVRGTGNDLQRLMVQPNRSVLATYGNTDGLFRATRLFHALGDSYLCYTYLAGERALVGGRPGVILFETGGDSGKILWRSPHYPGLTWAVAPSPDDRYVMAASSDQILRIWETSKPERTEIKEPLVSLFIAGDEWVAWTPEGYYAASPGGERLMGWHVNNDRYHEQMASFYPAAHFRVSLYRPDVIKLLLQAGSVEKALALADQARGKPSVQTEVDKVRPPKVAITAPAAGLRLQKTEVEVRATAQSVGNHPVTALRLLLNGRPYQGQASLKKVAAPKLGAVQESWTVELTPGRHRLAVQADSAVSHALSDEVAVVYVAEARPQVDLPSLYVLAVGVSAYPGDLKLNYAAKDAQAIEQVFREKSKPLFRRVETKLLTDKEATRTRVLQGLSWLRKEMTQRDVAVLFFAGHGLRDNDGRFYLLPADGDPADLLSTGVADDDLKKALAGMPGRVLALLDACHTGAVGGDKRRNAGPLTDDLVRDLVTDDYGVVVMASAMGREFALESNAHRHGCFTLALVEGLSGKAEKSQDGAVYLHKLDGYVTDRVKELTKGQQHPVTAKPTSVRSFPLAKP